MTSGLLFSDELVMTEDGESEMRIGCQMRNKLMDMEGLNRT